MSQSLSTLAELTSLREYDEMKQALRQSEGALLQSDLLALERSLRVFLGNCDELLGFLSATDDPSTAIQLWAVENREGFDRFLDEVDRFLHNVVAAAMSLREHSYRVRDKWLKQDQHDKLRDQHDDRVREVFAESRTAQLVEGLRIIVQHRKLPRLFGRAEWVRGGQFKSKIELDPDDLLEWEGWSDEMRASLAEGEGPVELGEIVADYRDSVVGFHSWFGSALRERNAETLEELKRGRRKLLEYASTMFGEPLDDPLSEEGL